MKNFQIVKNKSLKILLAVLLVKAFLLFALITWGPIHLAPDEAQYWTWSQSLNWGYYSKPPAIAWQIALTTLFFGNDEWGVRSGAVIIGFLFPLLLFYSAKKMELGEKTGMWAAILFALSPLGFYFSLATTTDAGATFFLTFALAIIALGMLPSHFPRYLLIGFLIGLGALFKWTAYVGWLFATFSFLFRKEKRAYFFPGFILSLFAFLPSLYWNWTHEWATFRHVGNTIVSKQLSQGNFFDFLAAQIGLLSPVTFFLIVFYATAILWKNRENKLPLVFCSSLILGLLGYLLTAIFKKIQPNWAAYLYPLLFIPPAWKCVQEKNRETWLWIAAIISAACVGLIFLMPFLQLPFRISPFRQNLGWEEIGNALKKVRYNPQYEDLIADKYQTASLLSFYGPEKKRAYFFNLSCRRKNQFSYWDPLPKGASGYFVVIENIRVDKNQWFIDTVPQKLSPYFEEVSFVEASPLYSVKGQGEKMMLLFRVKNFSGQFPQCETIY